MSERNTYTQTRNDQRFLDDAVRAEISNTALSGGAGAIELEPGLYHLLFTVASRFKQGADDVEVDDETGTPANENQWVFDVRVTGDDDTFIDVITTGTGETGFVEACRVR